MKKTNLLKSANSTSTTKRRMLDTIEELSSMSNSSLLSDTERSSCNTVKQSIESLCSDCFDDSDSDDTEYVFDTSRSVSIMRNFYNSCKYKEAYVCQADEYGKYTILKGSKIAHNSSDSCPEVQFNERRKLRREGVINSNDILLKDVTYDSPSACTNIISGQSTNGRVYLKKILWD